MQDRRLHLGGALQDGLQPGLISPGTKRGEDDV
jgi:hypothetical protein